VSNVAHLLHIDADAERFWVALREHSCPDARAGAAVAFLHRIHRDVTPEQVAGLADVDLELARDFAGRYHGGTLERVHAVAVGMAAAYDLTDYALGPAHPRRRRRLG
jgi:hypothetical protein